MYSLLIKSPFEMVIGQQMKEEGMIKINNDFVHLTFHSFAT